ncbi:MAG TPA: hypothetical protein EYP22_02170, partial [Methanosarcinales archaeon]|nr:hypothetical protein [Methanosarcinales archaeon]
MNKLGILLIATTVLVAICGTVNATESANLKPFFPQNPDLTFPDTGIIASAIGAPYKLAVIYAPNKVNADNSYSNDGYNYLVVQLQDINGNPALAANNI